jgi:hypothetical protein
MNTGKTPEYTQEDLHILFDYKDGVLFWKTPKRKSMVGVKAGCIDAYGYFVVRIWGKNYKLHRVIYHYHYGLSDCLLDHIDNNRANNKIENLRLCTPVENQRNRKSNRNRTVDLPKGVSINRSGKFVARIVISKKLYYLGCYETPELAHECYCLAADLVFGEFANYG